jgi:hypothetical protein
MVDFHIRGVKIVRFTLFTVVTIVFILGYAATGCGKGTATSTSPTKTSAIPPKTSTATQVAGTTSTTQSLTKTPLSTTTKTTTTTLTTQKTVSTDPFIRLDESLDDRDIFFQKTWMAAEAIGAKEGYKYATRSGTFELYLYDKESDAYKAAVKNNGISVGNTLFPAYIKDGFALYFYDNAKEELRTTIKEIVIP